MESGLWNGVRRMATLLLRIDLLLTALKMYSVNLSIAPTVIIAPITHCPSMQCQGRRAPVVLGGFVSFSFVGFCFGGQENEVC